MEKLDIVNWLRREARALLRFSPWILLSLLVAALMWRTDLAATSGLFQSPPTASPTPRPASPTPTSVLTATPTLTPTVVLTATVQPTETLEPSATPTEAPAEPTRTPLEPTRTPAATEAPPTIAPVPSATGGRGNLGPESGETQPDAGEDLALQFEWGELFDALALGASYLWMCCGIIVLLSIPVLFVVLWAASNRRQQEQDQEGQEPQEE